jgi:hypothetical protein
MIWSGCRSRVTTTARIANDYIALSSLQVSKQKRLRNQKSATPQSGVHWWSREYLRLARPDRCMICYCFQRGSESIIQRRHFQTFWVYCICTIHWLYSDHLVQYWREIKVLEAEVPILSCHWEWRWWCSCSFIHFQHITVRYGVSVPDGTHSYYGRA